MGDFFPNQRYTSEGEPELGIGIVSEVSKGRVQVFFPVADEKRLYSIENAPLRRVVFKPGDTIADIQKNSIVVKYVEQENEFYVYYGKEGKISEADLGDVSVSHNVDEKLFMGEVDPPGLFALRRETLENDYQRKISSVNGFVGGKIDLIPHQLYIANEVSSRFAPRVLLSDQVGLGKTIEACLILHRLLLSGRISRVLILVPESLVHQWFVELFRRFNLWFHIFDEERCVSLDEGAPDNNPFLDDQLIICSTEFLAGSEKRARQAISAGWNMLVVDEAHHLEWTIDNVSTEYSVVELLSKVAEGLLLLTATPEQLGLESHFARLRLLDPERYAKFDDFKNESSNHKIIAGIIEKLSAGKSLPANDKKLLTTLISEEQIKALEKGTENIRNKFIEDLLDQHGPGRVIFRNTRSAMSGFPMRKAHLYPLKVNKDKQLWIERFTNEFANDLRTTRDDLSNQPYSFDEDPRVLWIKKFLKKISPSKVLLICKTKEKVLALGEALSFRSNMKVGVFHEDLTIIQRDRNAAWFSESGGAQILLCSEIGSEGRNFQFAHHLVLFDLPLHPELVEQRIGRLDRIGQTSDINIHIPFLENSPQQVLIRWFHEGLNAFEENLEGGNRIFKTFSEKVISIAKSDFSKNNQIEKLISETSLFQKALKKKLADGRDRLLEMNSFRPKVAEKLVSKIQKEDNDKKLEMYMTRVFEYFDIEMEDLALRTWFLHPAATYTGVFPSIPKTGMAVTFDRKRALSREDVSFLSWDNPTVTHAIDMVRSSGIGSAGFGVLRGTGSPGLLLELVYVLETAGEKSSTVNRFLPNTPIRIVVDHSGKEITNSYPVEILNNNLIPGQIDALLENETFVETILPNMISAATNLAEKKGEKERFNGLHRMNNTLDHEIDRLKNLQKKNKNIRPDEIAIALNEQSNLANVIKNARIRMDAIQLIRKE